MTDSSGPLAARLKQRIQARLDALGISARAASIKAGLGPDAIRTVLQGRSQVPRYERLQALAVALECDIQYLIGDAHAPREATARFRAGLQNIVGGEIPLPVLHEVGAGLWRATEDVFERDPEFFSAPAIKGFEAFPQWFERVRGASVDKLGIADGALIRVIDALAIGYIPRTGDIVVAQRMRAQGAFIERSVKQVVVDADGGVELWGRSSEPRYNVPLSFASDLREGEEADVQIVGKVIGAYIQF